MKRHSALQQPSNDGWADSGQNAGAASQALRRNSDDDFGIAARFIAPQGAPIDEGLSMSMTQSYANLQQLALETNLLKQLQAQSQPVSRSRVHSEAGTGTVTPASGERRDREAALPSTLYEEAPGAAPVPIPTVFDVALPLVRQGYVAAVDDSFTRCFKSKKRVHWNWNLYLLPAWCFGLFFRYVLLFPLRLLCLALGFLMVGLLFPVVKLLGLCLPTRRTKPWETWLIQMLATAFVASWSGVIRIHGIRPKPRPGQPAGVFVANHSSMIDFIILLMSHPYAVVGQKHGGWVGFLQDHLLSSINCVWFDRSEAKDKKAAAERLRRHVSDPANAAFPILLFPEGTCVNNEYVVQFKKFVFELGVPVHPIAIKYSKVFVDAYWNSREQSFQGHLARLMTSWAVVADIWFLDPQHQRPGESGAQFATRIQHMIAHRAGLKPVPWDGYMKYWRPGPRFIQARQKAVAEEVCKAEGLPLPVSPKPEGAGGAAANGTAAAAAAAAAAATVQNGAAASSTDLSAAQAQRHAEASHGLAPAGGSGQGLDAMAASGLKGGARGSAGQLADGQAAQGRALSPSSEQEGQGSASAQATPLVGTGQGAGRGTAGQGAVGSLGQDGRSNPTVRSAATPYRPYGTKPSPGIGEQDEGGYSATTTTAHQSQGLLPVAHDGDDDKDRRGSADTELGGAIDGTSERSNRDIGLSVDSPRPASNSGQAVPSLGVHGAMGQGQQVKPGTPSRRSPMSPGQGQVHGSRSPIHLHQGN